MNGSSEIDQSNDPAPQPSKDARPPLDFGQTTNEPLSPRRAAQQAREIEELKREDRRIKGIEE